MSQNKKILIMIMLFGIFSCTNTSKFPLEKELIYYLNEVFGLETEQPLYVFFLQGKSCGSCTNSALDVIGDFYNQNDLPYVVLAGENIFISEWLHDHPNVLKKMLIDTKWQFEKYGLRFSNHCFFYIVHNKIYFSAWISENNMGKLYDFLAEKNILSETGNNLGKKD